MEHVTILLLPAAVVFAFPPRGKYRLEMANQQLCLNCKMKTKSKQVKQFYFKCNVEVRKCHCGPVIALSSDVLQIVICVVCHYFPKIEFSYFSF